MIPDVIYISGPITDPKTGRPMKGWEERFEGMEKHLQQQGFTTLSPAVIAHLMDKEHERILSQEGPADPPSRDDYLMTDLRIMKECHDDGHLAGILMLDGWQQSDGAQCEYHLARVLGIPVFSQSDHGYQLNEHRVAYRPDTGDAHLRWYTLAELSAAIREDYDHAPYIKELHKFLSGNAESCAEELA
ncbi:MAG: DUF4406 domain-containing protein [Bacteroidaceae bacterium]|nr:DUF4406 domain-containing protein [Bacteroidaceae bacterium]